MNAVLEWVKSNLFIVIFAVLMIAAAIVLPWFSGRMNQGVRETVSTRSQNIAKLNQLEKSEILPGFTGVPNDATLARYERVAKVISEDAARVQQASLEHNRKGRGVLMPELFPQPPEARMEVLPKQFHERLMDAYGTLLHEVGAGMPPDQESLKEAISGARTQFITQDLKKDLSENLDEDQKRQLAETLTAARMSLYAEAAGRIRMYLSTDAISPPVWNQANPPALGELFNWQWQYWIVEDIIRALQKANEDTASVLQAAAKRVLYLDVVGLPAAGSSGSAQSRGGMAAGGGFGGGAGSRSLDNDFESPTSSTGAAGVAPNPKAKIEPNYSASITGRTTNPLYDVIHVQLGLVVETSRLPDILDALSQYNFMTVTSLNLKSADAFDALADGFFYGSAPLSEVHMTLETVWLRGWTSEFMPTPTKQALGIPEKATEAPAETF